MPIDNIKKEIDSYLFSEELKEKVEKFKKFNIDKEPILIWRFCDTPKEIQDLSPHGGDEDWVAYIPKNYTAEYLGFLEEGSNFGCCGVSEHSYGDGKILIGAHA